jgi:hypothetical protein
MFLVHALHGRGCLMVLWKSFLIELDVQKERSQCAYIGAAKHLRQRHINVQLCPNATYNADIHLKRVEKLEHDVDDLAVEAIALCSNPTKNHYAYLTSLIVLIAPMLIIFALD